MAVAGLRAVYQWVLRTMMKSKGETGIVQAIPNKDLIELNTQVTAQRLMQNGIDPTTLKNPDQVENVIKMIESKPATGGVTSTKTAKIMDMEGKEIPKGSKIMGGKAVDDDLPPPGSRGGKDDIAAPIQSADESLKDMTEAEIKKKLEKGNKEGIARIRARQKMIEEAIDNVSPGFSGDLRVDADLLAEEMATRMGKVYDDLPNLEGTRLYGEAYDALSKKRFQQKETKRIMDDMKEIEDPEDLAQGGRAGFSKGKLVDLARRKFLKTAASVGAGIGALKTGLLGLGKQAAPMVEAAKETVTQAPSYFFDLVAKIKLFGKQRQTPSYKERVNEFTYTGKNGDQYELIEDLDTGEIMIQKDKIGGRSFEEGSYDVIEDRTEMRYKKPKPDEGDPNPSEEYEEYKVEFDRDGTPADAVDIDEISKKEIIKEATGDAPSIKKAGGGIARMLGE